MLSKGYSYYPHHGPAGIARRRPRPDSACLWPAPAISLFFLFRAFSPPAPRGALPGRITLPLNRDGRHIARMPFSLKRKASAGLRHWRHNPMLRSEDRVSAYSALFMLFALFGLTSCNLSDQPKLPKPPFKTPVNLSHKGVVADFDIRVPKHRIYRFRMRFEYPEEDRAEREHVRRLVGDYGRDKNNNLIEPGILTPVKLTIFKGESVIYQRIIKDPETYAHGSGFFAKLIGHCDLKRGKYRFVLESLAQLQEYASIPTKFVITFSNIFKFSSNLKGIDRSKTCPQ